MVGRYGFVLASAIAHVAAFALLVPQISYQPVHSAPLTIDLLIAAPEPPPVPDPPDAPEPEPPEPDESEPLNPAREEEIVSTPAPPQRAEPSTPVAPATPAERVTLPPQPVRPVPPTQTPSPAPSQDHVRAVRSILCLRLTGRERAAYGCDKARGLAAPSEAAAVPTREAQRVRDQHTATLAASDRKDSYAEQMMARNSDIPAVFLGRDR